MGKKSAFSHNVIIVIILTLLSRIFGLARDIVFAALFGAGKSADAFNIAFTIPNILRRFLAEGALSIAFVPVFTHYHTKYDSTETHRLYNITFSWFTVILLITCLVGTLVSPLLVKLFAPGFEADKFELCLFLTRVMFPYLFFIGLASLCVGILNTYEHFAAPAGSPILLNLAIIVCALSFYRAIHPPITAMAIGVLVGGVLQVGLQIPFLHICGVRLRFEFTRGHPAIRKMFTLMGPAVFGVLVYQVNILVSRALASLLSEGSVTYIYYSDRFIELPLGVFAVAIATVNLPRLSQYASRADFGKLKQSLQFALKLTLLVCIPTMVWMAVSRVPLISTLLERGQFDHTDSLICARVFLAGSGGIWAVACVRNLVPAFYALNDIKTPVKIAFASFLVNAGLGAILMWPLGPAGLTAANTISSTFNFILLTVFLKRKIGPFEDKNILSFVWRISLAGVAAGIVAWLFSLLDTWSISGELGYKILYLGLAGLSSVGVFIGVAFLLRVKELAELFKHVFYKT